jgi:HAD superfamily hydrolase (TIGR01509 family)
MGTRNSKIQSLARVRAIFFDLDGTLLNHELGIRTAVSRTCTALSKRYQQIISNQLEKVYLNVAKRIWFNYGSVPRASGSQVSSVKEIRWEIWGKALQAYGLSSKEILTEAVGIYAKERKGTYFAFPETMQVIKALKCDHSLGVITNGPGDVQREKLTVTGISLYMDVSLSSGDFGIGKPDPRIFLRALELIKVSHEEAIFVGDSIKDDVLGAKGVGMYTIWINRMQSNRLPDLSALDIEIEDLRELLPLLEVAGPAK